MARTPPRTMRPTCRALRRSDNCPICAADYVIRWASHLLRRHHLRFDQPDAQAPGVGRHGERITAPGSGVALANQIIGFKVARRWSVTTQTRTISTLPLLRGAGYDYTQVRSS